jgi:hypothetical protein
VSRGTCSGTASIGPLQGYIRHWDGKRAATVQYSAAIFQHGRAIIALQIEID